ncbi:winged helix-turn-helix domain-containing protein, partial [Providencia rettgeri]
MKKIIIINDNIVYYPDNNKLQNVSHPEKTVILNGPSARCLDILLASDEELVTHKELYTKAWIGSNQEPSPNTLYQNILLVRRGLKDVSDEEVNYIITVPRKGFYFNKNISIVISTEDQKNINLKYEKPDVSEKTKNVKTITSSKPSKWGVILLNIILLALLLVLLVSFYFIKKSEFQKNSNFFDNYAFNKNEGNCKIYLNKNNEITMS